MALPNARQQYLKTQIETASKEQLVVMLFDGIIRFTEIARKAIESGQIEDSHFALMRAQAIVMELICTVDKEKGGDIASNLMALHAYSFNCLITANMRKDTTKLDEVQNIYRKLREGWVGAMENLGISPTAAKPQPGQAAPAQAAAATTPAARTPGPAPIPKAPPTAGMPRALPTGQPKAPTPPQKPIGPGGITASAGKPVILGAAPAKAPAATGGYPANAKQQLTHVTLPGSKPAAAATPAAVPTGSVKPAMPTPAAAAPTPARPAAMTPAAPAATAPAQPAAAKPNLGGAYGLGRAAMLGAYKPAAPAAAQASAPASPAPAPAAQAQPAPAAAPTSTVPASAKAAAMLNAYGKRNIA